MIEERAALRLGYLVQELRYRMQTVLKGILHKIKDVQVCLKELDRVLILLSSRMNGYQRASVVDLWKQISARHDDACRSFYQLYLKSLDQVGIDPKEAMRQLPTLLSTDDGIERWKYWQEEDWEDVRALFRAIVGYDEKCSPWFEIGDHMGHVVFQFIDNQLPVPLESRHWDYLYSGVDKLSPRVQRRLNDYFPKNYINGYELASLLAGTFRDLCNLLAMEEYGLDAVPKFDGVTLVYRNHRKKIRTLSEKTSVIVPILRELERQGWPENLVSLPPNLKGNVKQAIYNFNKQYKIVRLSLVDSKVGWR